MVHLSTPIALAERHGAVEVVIWTDHTNLVKIASARAKKRSVLDNRVSNDLLMYIRDSIAEGNAYLSEGEVSSG